MAMNFMAQAGLGLQAAQDYANQRERNDLLKQQVESGLVRNQLETEDMQERHDRQKAMRGKFAELAGKGLSGGDLYKQMSDEAAKTGDVEGFSNFLNASYQAAEQEYHQKAKPAIMAYLGGDLQPTIDLWNTFTSGPKIANWQKAPDGSVAIERDDGSKDVIPADKLDTIVSNVYSPENFANHIAQSARLAWEQRKDSQDRDFKERDLSWKQQKDIGDREIDLQKLELEARRYNDQSRLNNEKLKLDERKTVAQEKTAGAKANAGQGNDYKSRNDMILKNIKSLVGFNDMTAWSDNNQAILMRALQLAEENPSMKPDQAARQAVQEANDQEKSKVLEKVAPTSGGKLPTPWK